MTDDEFLIELEEQYEYACKGLEEAKAACAAADNRFEYWRTLFNALKICVESERKRKQENVQTGIL